MCQFQKKYEKGFVEGVVLENNNAKTQIGKIIKEEVNILWSHKSYNKYLTC